MMDFRAVGARGSDERTPVVILTMSYRIVGEIALVPGARLTDFVSDAGAFIAVTNARVICPNGQEILAAPFLNVNRDHIEVIVPAETAEGEGEPRGAGLRFAMPGTCGVSKVRRGPEES